jgi:Tol biopolymer transport system component
VSLIGNIMNAEPASLAAAQPLTPLALDRLVKKCLAKHPDDRWDTAHDVADELRWIGQAGTLSPVPSGLRRELWRGVGLVTTLVVVTAMTTAGLLWHFRSPVAEPRPVTYVEISLPPNVELYRGTAPGATLSPDASKLVFVGIRDGVRQLYMRARNTYEALPLSGTASTLVYTCFFSPDGRAVGYISAGGLLSRVTLADGLVATVTRDATTTAGGAWGADGRITFARGGVLWQVDADGTRPRQVTTLNEQRGEVLHQWPVAVRGGQTILFASVASDKGAATRVEGLSVATGERRTLVEPGTYPLYASSGHLVFFRDGALLAAPFDVERVTATGPPVRVLEDIEVDSYGSPLVTLSEAGVLAYVPRGSGVSRLVWVSRGGLERSATDALRRYQFPRLSPDGRRIVVGEGGSLWIQDTSRAALSRLTSDESVGNAWPVWTLDGKRVVFRTLTGMRWIDADGAGASRAIPATSVADHPSSVAPDGRALAFMRLRADTSSDVYVVSLSGDSQARPLLATPAYEGAPQFSPDGRWLCYVSNESGEMEVYVRPFPRLDQKWQVSTKGGNQPRWSKNGHELVYRSGTKMMAVAVSTVPEFALSEPKVLFEGRYAFGPGATTANYDVSADGLQFLMVKDEPGSNGLKVVLNWFEELKAKVPAGGAK